MGNFSKLKSISLYANSLYESANKNKSLVTVYKDSKKLLQIHEGIFNSFKVLDNPLYKYSDKIQIIDDIAKKIKLSEEFINLLKILAENKKTNELKQIIQQFINIYNIKHNIAEIDVSSVVELSKIQKQNLLEKLKKIFNKDMIINYYINPEILGGIIIKYDDIIMDASVQNKLKKLHGILKGNI